MIFGNLFFDEPLQITPISVLHDDAESTFCLLEEGTLILDDIGRID
jgi:hypothetical protein